MSAESEKTFTPGPWEAVQADDPRGQPVPYYRALICTVEHSPDRHLSVVAQSGNPVSPEEWPANAALISAAPELLAALEATVPMLVLAAHEARKKDDFEAAQRFSDTAENARAIIAKAKGEPS